MARSLHSQAADVAQLGGNRLPRVGSISRQPCLKRRRAGCQGRTTGPFEFRREMEAAAYKPDAASFRIIPNLAYCTVKLICPAWAIVPEMPVTVTV